MQNIMPSVILKGSSLSVAGGIVFMEQLYSLNTLSLPKEEVSEIIKNSEKEYCLLYYKYSKH